MRRIGLQIGALAVLLAAAGCASTSPGDASFVKVDTVVIDASFEDAWQMTKEVLREGDYLIYTRDKRGFFLAYSDIKRRRLVPRRTQFSLSLEALTSDSTKVTIETARQNYGVTLRTYPGWRDRPTESNEEAITILEALKAKAGGGGEIAPVEPAV